MRPVGCPTPSNNLHTLQRGGAGMGSHLTSGSSGARHARVPVGPFLGFGEATTTVTVVATVAANGHCNSWLQLDLALDRRKSWNGSRAPCILMHLERSLAQYSGRRSHQYVLVPLLHRGLENRSWLLDLSWRWDEPSPASPLDPEEGISIHTYPCLARLLAGTLY